MIVVSTYQPIMNTYTIAPGPTGGWLGFSSGTLTLAYFMYIIINIKFNNIYKFYI